MSSVNPVSCIIMLWCCWRLSHTLSQDRHVSISFHLHMLHCDKWCCMLTVDVYVLVCGFGLRLSAITEVFAHVHQVGRLMPLTRFSVTTPHTPPRPFCLSLCRFCFSRKKLQSRSRRKCDLQGREELCVSCPTLSQRPERPFDLVITGCTCAGSPPTRLQNTP